MADKLTPTPSKTTTATTEKAEKAEKTVDLKDDEELFKSIIKDRIEQGVTIDPNRFCKPDMGDYLQDSISISAYQELEKALDPNSVATGTSAMFYNEEPPSTSLGYDANNNVFIIKAVPIFKASGKRQQDAKREKDLNVFDGDTIYFDAESIQDGDTSFTIGSAKYNNVKDYIEENTSKTDANVKRRFAVRFVGVNAPEIPHYAYMPVDSIKSHESEVSVIKVSYEKIKDKSNYIYDKIKHKDDSKDKEIVMLQIASDKNTKIYREVDCNEKGEPITYTDYDDNKKEVKSYKYLSQYDVVNEEHLKQGMAAKEDVCNLLSSCEDMLIVLDGKMINKNSASIPQIYQYDPWEQICLDIKTIWNSFLAQTYPYLGYNSYGQDMHKRFLGCIYFKKGGQWINLSKYLISKYNLIEVNPSYKNDPMSDQHMSFASNAFKLWSYGLSRNARIVDSLSEMTRENIDDRNEIQKNIMGYDFDYLKSWTLMIGDCLFMVPPTSIRSITQMTNEKLPLIRANGSMIKGGHKTIRDIELTLYFNKDGVNGVPYTDNKGRTYYMNGLRALIAQFKRTPFLPVENDYINNVLNIEAVTMLNMQIQTVPGYPSCLSAVLTLQEFDYRAYMPEIPIPDAEAGEGIHTNMFAKTIDFEVMRWYYQQPILKGEEVKGMDANDEVYINSTFGSRNVFQPMEFGNSNIDFYIPDMDSLDKMLQLKLNALNYTVQSNPVLSDSAKKWLNSLGEVYVKLSSLSNDGSFSEALRALNEKKTIGDKSYALGYTGSSVLKGGNKLNKLNESNVVKVLSESKVVKGSDFITDYADPIFDAISSKLIGQNGVSAVTAFTVEEDYTTTKKTKNGEEGIVSWEITLTINMNGLSESEAKNAVNQVLTSLQIDSTKKENIESIFNGHWNVKISLKGKFEVVGSERHVQAGTSESGFYLDTSSNGYAFLKRCAAMSNLSAGKSEVSEESEDIDSSNAQNMQEALLKAKENLDIETSSTIKFNKYPVEDLKVESIAAVISNTLAKISLQSIEGYAPQYLGGQDTVLEVTCTTKNRATATLIQELPRLAAQYARDYRLVLSFWPLRIDSEITRLLGINEVVIENVMIETMPGFPGMYKITMRLMSVDRALRNKESLKKVDVALNNGSISNTSKGSLVEKSYFDLQKSLAQTEIYPDLELPTIDELAQNGFRFIRYSGSKSNRIYPDPDFYFVYAHILGSEMFRDTVLNFFNNTEWKDKTDFNLSDIYGANVSIKYDKSKVFSIVDNSENDAAISMKNELEAVKKGVAEVLEKSSTSSLNKENKKNTDVNYENIVTAAAISGEYQMWNIADEVKVLFREKRYIQDLEKKDNDKNNKYADALTERVNKVIELIDKELGSPMKGKKSGTANIHSKAGMETAGVAAAVNKADAAVDEFVKSFFGSKSAGYAIIDALCPDEDARDGVIEEMSNILKAAASGYSGQKLYSSDIKNTDWKAVPFISIKGKSTDSEGNPIPTCKVSVSEQGVTGTSQASSYSEALKYGIEFGMYGTKQYTVEYVKRILPEKAGSLKEDRYFLDPYYMDKQIEGDSDAVLEYKKSILSDPYYSAYAFTRNMLFWLKRLLKDNILYAMYDIVGEKSLEYIKSAQKVSLNNANPFIKDKAGVPDTNAKSDDETKETIKNIKNILKNSRKPLAVGKIVSSCMLALLSGDKFIYNLMKNRNYDQLNSTVRYINAATLPFEEGEKNANIFAKFINALVGTGTIKKSTSIGNNTDTVDSYVSKIIDERVWIEAANNPYEYMLHSFYDMVMNDKRGRMLRAFPTFYMMFIDEGREIGLWKLHDNFYGVNAISEVQVTRSRKIAADTATITMSNMFKTFNTDDEDIRLGYNDYTWKDAFNSIFSPKTYYVKEEVKRMNMNPMARTTLRPGIRMHVRIGYGADASTLPIAFNGCIAEITTDDIVQIVAQGDGVELTNPLLSSMDAEDVQNQDEIIINRMWKNWITHGASPRTILSSLLVTKGGFVPKAIYNYTNGRFFNKNPYGIVHFGEPEYRAIFQNGECTQNIYEGSQKPNWGDDGKAITGTIREEYATENTPKISCHIYGKSYWDIMQICASAAPDYIASVAPFGVRSTIFYGAPRFYYAYDYVKDVSPESGEEVIKEKRKPFQQYHIYTSYSDIIANAIKTSEMDVRTCAVGLYQQSGWLGKQSPKRVGPMWVK